MMALAGVTSELDATISKLANGTLALASQMLKSARPPLRLGKVRLVWANQPLASDSRTFPSDKRQLASGSQPLASANPRSGLVNRRLGFGTPGMARGVRAAQIPNPGLPKMVTPPSSR